MNLNNLKEGRACLNLDIASMETQQSVTFIKQSNASVICLTWGCLYKNDRFMYPSVRINVAWSMFKNTSVFRFFASKYQKRVLE